MKTLIESRTNTPLKLSSELEKALQEANVAAKADLRNRRASALRESAIPFLRLSGWIIILALGAGLIIWCQGTVKTSHSGSNQNQPV